MSSEIQRDEEISPYSQGASNITITLPTTFDEELVLFRQLPTTGKIFSRAPKKVIIYDRVKKPLRETDHDANWQLPSEEKRSVKANESEEKVSVGAKVVGFSEDQIFESEFTIGKEGKLVFSHAPAVPLNPESNKQQGKIESGWELRIIQFPACEQLEVFLRYLGGQLGEGPPKLLESKNLRKLDNFKPNFITGVSLSASNSTPSGNQGSFTLFVAIPYLSAIVAKRESLALSTFVTGVNTEKTEDQIEELEQAVAVSQAYFVITSGDINSGNNTNSKGNSTNSEGNNINSEGNNTNSEGNNTNSTARLRTIALFRSADDDNADQPPVFPGQSRAGSLDTFVTMLAASIQGSEKQELEKIRTEALEQENQFQKIIKEEIKYRNDVTLEGVPAVKRISEMLLSSKSYSCHAENIKYMIERQLEILKQLRQIFENASVTPEGFPPAIPEAGFRSVWEVPVITKGHAEELIIAVIKLDGVIKAREGLFNSVKGLIADLKDAQNYLFQSLSGLIAEDRDYLPNPKPSNPSNPNATPGVAPDDAPKPESKGPKMNYFERKMVEKKKREEFYKRNPARATLEEAKRTGEMISLFTVFTNVFLPLSFFPGYYAMDVTKDRISSPGDFWAVAGPLTAAFTIISIVVALHKRNFDEKLVSLLWDLFTKLKSKCRGDKGPDQADKEKLLET